jgi:hypothetical protein
MKGRAAIDGMVLLIAEQATELDRTELIGQAHIHVHCV